ncbi:hypothetical protein LDENG_00108840 [Lucifuga dentata]|nr:hypothetical protein LDENG_00108840 [Lucifuga dentata]
MPSACAPTVQACGGSVMIWGCFSWSEAATRLTSFIQYSELGSMRLSLVSMGILKIVLFILEAVLLTDCARGPPRVAEKVAHRQTARLGSAIKLPCPVEGDPPPLIMWTKDGRNIHSGWIRFRILRMGLKIKEVEADDTGTYICKATNGFGSVNVNYTLIVIGPSDEIIAGYKMCHTC